MINVVHFIIPDPQPIERLMDWLPFSETVANTIAGFLIFWDRPFKIGDYITTQSLYGEVREITLRTTRIRTNDNTFVVIPNKQVIGDTLVNHSMYGATRVVVEIGIAYKEKIAESARTLLVRDAD